MSKEVYREKSFNDRDAGLIDECNAIVDRYVDMNIRMTLRQLYYQLVTRNTITNEEKSYKRLAKLVSDARLAGLIDWDAIEDRGRRPSKHSEWDSIQDIVASALHSFRLPRWADQENCVELWVEKDALSSVLAPIADRHHITLMVNRGYSSQSAMYASARRFIDNGEGKNCVLLYLGDHDPSGEDMVRDIRERMEMFGADLEVKKVALTMAQIEEYEPPPNPAKVSDPRAGAYIEEHGDYSWEVDALPPEVLNRMLDAEILSYVDGPAWQAVLAREVELKAALKKAAGRIK